METTLFMPGDLPHIASPGQAIAAGFELMNMGADAACSGMSLTVVEAMAREYIPVAGRIGFVPCRSTWIGGARMEPGMSITDAFKKDGVL
ncbi:MAG: hypothetical protein MUC91_04070 [Verrucomicrobia bacterium]|nr:hypothetical protein [Verrucomicrobiota bacterium]